MSQVSARVRPSKGLSTVLRAAPFAFLLAVPLPAQAQREDQGLQLGCASDFFRLCAGVDPNSQDADRCMNRNRPRLSPQCRAAISGYEGRTGTRTGGRRQQQQDDDED